MSAVRAYSIAFLYSPGKRVRKLNACPYCDQLSKKIGEHIYRKHADKKDVQKILICTDLKEKRRLTSILVSRANFNYNQKLRLKPNWDCKELILKYQKKTFADKVGKDEILGCHFCGAAYFSNSLYRHKCVAGYKDGKRPGERIYIKSISNRSWSYPMNSSSPMKKLLNSLQ